MKSLETLFHELKAEIKTAIESYIEYKAGDLEKLSEHRKAPCYELLGMLQHTPSSDWLCFKRDINRICEGLVTGLLGRSELRRCIFEVLHKPEYFDDRFYHAEKQNFQNTIERLKGRVEFFETHQSHAELTTALERALEENRALSSELERAKFNYQDLESKYNAIKDQNFELQSAEPREGVRSFTLFEVDRQKKYKDDEDVSPEISPRLSH